MTTKKERDWRLCGMDPSLIPKASLDFFADVKGKLPRADVRTIVDVGANVGEFSARALSAFPQAELYCLEPIARTFAVLSETFASRPNVRCCQVAMGAKPGSGLMLLEPSAVSNRLVDPSANPGRRFEEVKVGTIDEFCAERGLSDVDLMKIDTEGHDLEVLRGAEGMLSGMKISLIQVEAGMHAANSLHVPLEELRGHLEARGYLLFGIYNQALEMKRPHLRRCDPVFISRRLIERHVPDGA